MSSGTDKYGWHIINSTYARIGYLERQKNLSNYIPFDTVQWLKDQINKFGVGIFDECLKTLANSNVLILGEAIIDEYIYCDALGKVTKDPLIAFEKRTKHEHFGGVLAVAKHFSGLGINATVKSDRYSLPIMYQIKATQHGESYLNGAYESYNIFRKVLKTVLSDVWTCTKM